MSKKSIGETVLELLKRQWDDERVAAEVKRRNPKAGTSAATIKWYRQKLRKEGHKVPTSRELKAKR